MRPRTSRLSTNDPKHTARLGDIMPNSSATGITQSYYRTLGLSQKALDDASLESTQALIKRAYRKALLRHHPDKAAAAIAAEDAGPSSISKIPDVTVDEVSAAFAVLFDPARRAEYDKTLRITAAPGAEDRVVFQTGVENVDLDDLEVGADDDGATEWHRSCRCGNPRGYRLREQDLEEAAQCGDEVMVGCADCSLWLRVHFAVLEDGGGGADDDAHASGSHDEDGAGAKA